MSGQIVVGASIEAFLNALGYNRRVRSLVYTATASPEEVMLAVANAYHAIPKHEFASRLDVREKQAQFYRDNCKVRLCYNENTAEGGYIVLNGELIAFHNIQRGKGRWMLNNAVQDGATKLDCFDVPALVDLYKSAGFQIVKREPNWVAGEPDVVWMEIL